MAKAIEKDYIKAAHSCGLAVGDKCKMVKSFQFGEKGYRYHWCQGMGGYIGKEITIKRIDSGGRINPEGSGYDFPYFVLEKIKTHLISLTNETEFLHVNV